MSNVSINIHWIDRIELRKHCEHDNGRVTFYLTAATNYGSPISEPESISFTLTANAAAVSKFERIAAFIAAINAEPDDAHAAASTPLVEAFTAE